MICEWRPRRSNPDLDASPDLMAVVCLLTFTLILITGVTSVAIPKTSKSGSKYAKGQVISLWYARKVVLNEGAQSTISESEPTVSLVEDIRKCMLDMKSSAMLSDGSAVDYESLRREPSFSTYLLLVNKLKFISLDQLSSKERKACLINIYNCLILHAIISGLLNADGGTVSRLKLYATAAYNIGGIPYSLNDIENGLLRGNRKSAVPLTFLPFRAQDDPRRSCMLECDPRIHFALNCGAVSCPPIAVYSADKLDEQLELSTRGFLDQSVAFDDSSDSVMLSMLFSWYRQDFVTDVSVPDSSMLNWVKGHSSSQLRERIMDYEKKCGELKKSPSVKFSAYDWGVNSF